MADLRVMMVGDSLAGGMHATTVEQGFSELLLAHLRRRFDRVHALRAQEAGGTIKVVSILAVPAEVDLIVIELGTNDSLHTPPWRFAHQYDELLTMVRESSPEAPLVCLGLWRHAWRAWPYDRSIKRLAQKHGGTFVPLSDLYSMREHRGPAGVVTDTPSRWVRDNMHPNDAGHAAIAERLVSALPPL